MRLVNKRRNKITQRKRIGFKEKKQKENVPCKTAEAGTEI